METLEPLLPTPQAFDGIASGLEAKEYNGKTAHAEKLEQALARRRSTSLPGGFLVSPSVALGSDKARRTTAISGQKCSVLLKNASPVGSLGRMLLASSRWYSTRCFLIWRIKVTPHKRLLFQLAPSTLRTDEIGYGLLPTASTKDVSGGAVKTDKGFMGISKQGKKHGAQLHDVMKMLSTPNRRDYKSGRRKTGHHYLMLSEQVVMLPTPKAGKRGPDYAKLERSKTGISLETKIGGAKTGLKLQPAFVEWMMGFPQGWTDLNCQNPSTGKKGSRRSVTP